MILSKWRRGGRMRGNERMWNRLFISEVHIFPSAFLRTAILRTAIVSIPSSRLPDMKTSTLVQNDKPTLIWSVSLFPCTSHHKRSVTLASSCLCNDVFGFFGWWKKRRRGIVEDEKGWIRESTKRDVTPSLSVSVEKGWTCAASLLLETARVEMSLSFCSVLLFESFRGTTFGYELIPARQERVNDRSRKRDSLKWLHVCVCNSSTSWQQNI